MSSFLDDLLGAWRLKRTSSQGVLIGQATCTRHTHGIRYSETLQTPTAHGTVEAYRDYLYQLDGDLLSIRHDSGPQRGQLFLQLPLQHVEDVWTGRGEHLCGDDVYHAEIELELPQRWRFAVVANGPRKAFAWETTYDRT